MIKLKVTTHILGMLYSWLNQPENTKHFDSLAADQSAAVALWRTVASIPKSGIEIGRNFPLTFGLKYTPLFGIFFFSLGKSFVKGFDWQ